MLIKVLKIAQSEPEELEIRCHEASGTVLFKGCLTNSMPHDR